MISSIFSKSTNRARISVRVTTRAKAALAGLNDTVGGPSGVNNALLPLSRQSYPRFIYQWGGRTKTPENKQMEAIIPKFIHIGDLRVNASYGVLAIFLVILLLPTMIIDRCAQRIFLTEWKIVLYHLKTVEILSPEQRMASWFADTTFCKRMPSKARGKGVLYMSWTVSNQNCGWHGGWSPRNYTRTWEQ